MVARYADQSLSDLARRKALSRAPALPALLVTTTRHLQVEDALGPFSGVPAACDFLSVKAGVERFLDGFALDQLDQRGHSLMTATCPLQPFKDSDLRVCLRL